MQIAHIYPNSRKKKRKLNNKSERSVELRALLLVNKAGREMR